MDARGVRRSPHTRRERDGICHPSLGGKQVPTPPTKVSLAVVEHMVHLGNAPLRGSALLCERRGEGISMHRKRKMHDGPRNLSGESKLQLSEDGINMLAVGAFKVSEHYNVHESRRASERQHCTARYRSPIGDELSPRSGTLNLPRPESSLDHHGSHRNGRNREEHREYALEPTCFCHALKDGG